jgi:hypothetical protein
MRARALVPFFLAVGSSSCLHVYHPDFHPEISTRYVQNISYPVTVRVLSSTPEAASPSPPPRSTAAARSPRVSDSAPITLGDVVFPADTVSVRPHKAHPSSAATKHYFATRGASPEWGLGSVNVTASRLGTPLPSRSKDCTLGLFRSAFVDPREYEQVGVVQITKAPVDIDPMSAPVRAVVREHACKLGGSYVALTSSSTIATPAAADAASTYMIYSVYAAKPADDGPSLF